MIVPKLCILAKLNAQEVTTKNKVRFIDVMATFWPSLPPKTPVKPITIAIVGAGDR